MSAERTPPTATVLGTSSSEETTPQAPKAKEKKGYRPPL